MGLTFRRFLAVCAFALGRATPGTGTGSATPLGWTHAQFIRLAWSLDAGHPVEQPRAVACRYVKRCR